MSPPPHWGKTAWELERLDNEDEEASLWIARAIAIKSLWYELNPKKPFLLW